MHYFSNTFQGTTTQALADQETLRRELTPGSRRSPSPYTHLLSATGRPHVNALLYRALSLGVLSPRRGC